MKNELAETVYPCHVPDRLLNAPLFSFDIPRIIEKIKQEDVWKRGERNAITLLKNSSIRIVLIALHKQNKINFNQSGNFLSVQLMEGTINLLMKNQSVLLKKGSLLTLHEEMKHELIAMEESVLLLTIAIDPANLSTGVNDR